MNKQIIKVPKGIQFISNWEDYEIPKGKHYIVDKGVTGCGYTEYCLTNNDNIVLVSPRKILMENKIAQHRNDRNIYYAENNITDNESRVKYINGIARHIEFCLYEGLPCKIMVSYDSLHYVVSILTEYGLISSFIQIVDEFQSIFLDSFFKAEVELDFVETLQQCESVVYLSATPMLDKYLEKLDQFKNLDFYKLDWSETGFVETIHIERKRVNSLTTECGKIITKYLEGDFPITINSRNEIVQSKEAVFYLNSVNDITRIIKKYDLKEDTTRIICSDTSENVARLKKIKFKVGKVPLKDEKNPMFMFCTSTSYVGVDFYSDNASSFVFADPNLKCLALDISLDLPQIIGRQRDKSNPFKNMITLFHKTNHYKKNNYTEEDFINLQRQRREETSVLLEGFNKLSDRERAGYIKKIRSDIQVSQYSDDFISISKETNLPVYNPLIDIANERAWEVSQKEYQDTLTVTKSLEKICAAHEDNSEESILVTNFLKNDFYVFTKFSDRMKAYCKFRDRYYNNPVIVVELCRRLSDPRFFRYYSYYGSGGCGSRKYQENELLSGLKADLSRSNDLPGELYNTFKVGEKYPMSTIKEIVGEIFKRLEITDRKPKATILLDYFEMSRTRITLPDKKVVEGYKILSRRE